jgi:hypothetical protein
MTEPKIQKDVRPPLLQPTTGKRSGNAQFDAVLDLYMNPNFGAAQAVPQPNSSTAKIPAQQILNWAVANGAQFGNRKYIRGEKTASATTGVIDAAPMLAETDPTLLDVTQADPFGRVADLARDGNSQAIMMMAQKKVMEMGQQFNMQYLLLQQMMEKDNRQYTMVTNTLKAKSESAKAVIKNLG